MAIRLLVCDDHEVIRSGMVTILAGSEIEVVAQAANGNEALEQVEAVKPDVVLLDIRMPGSDGLATLEKIKSIAPDIKVVMLFLLAGTELL